jgi:hypothetical protein
MSTFQTVFANGTILPGYTGKIILSQRDLSTNPFALVNGQDNVWNTIDLAAGDAGLWLFGGGNVGIYCTSQHNNPPVNSTIVTYHADHNNSGSINITSSPGGGSTTAMHISSNNPNGYIFPQGMRPYIVTGEVTIRFVMQPVWDVGTCIAYGVAMGIKLF